MAKIQKKIEAPTGALIEAAPNALSPYRRRVRQPPGTRVLTEQSHKQDCDINHIVAKYQGDELRALMKQRPEIYRDISEPLDLQTALNMVNNANAQFASLPSRVRREFANDPVEFLAFATNPQNAQRMVELGLATKRPTKEPEAPQAPPKETSKKKAPVPAPSKEDNES